MGDTRAAIPAPATMLAATYHKHGDPAKVVAVEQVQRPPAPGAGQLLVRVKAASLNPADWKSGEGGQKLLLCFEWPRVYGFDFSGEVAAVGEGAERFAVGEQVFGMIRGLPEAHRGTMAEYCLVDADICARKPRTYATPHVLAKVEDEAVPHAAAASLPLVGITAVKMFRACGLVERSVLPNAGAGSAAFAAQASMRVLITGGAGGMGTIAIQLAKRLYGVAHVTATASPGDKTDVCRRLGADAVVNYREKGWAKALKDEFDVILDCTGEAADLAHLLRKHEESTGARRSAMCSILAGPTQDALLTWLKEARIDPSRITFGVHSFLHSGWGGRFTFQMASGASGLKKACAKQNGDFHHVIGTGDGAIVAVLARLLETREVEAVIDSEYPLCEAVAAIARQKSGRALGKVIVDPSGSLDRVRTPSKHHPYTLLPVGAADTATD